MLKMQPGVNIHYPFWSVLKKNVKNSTDHCHMKFDRSNTVEGAMIQWKHWQTKGCVGLNLIFIQWK